jgi:peptidoglycan/LPS O-acetylase OafA/YrhL
MTDMTDFAESILAVLTFSSNLLFWSETSYFDTAGEMKPLLHTWSLAVEEQYYIAFPLLLLAVRRTGPLVATWVLAVLAAASLLLAQFAVELQPSAAFFLLPTRAWELLIGAIVSLLHLRRPQAFTNQRILSEVGGLAGLGMIAYALWSFDPSTPTPSFTTLIPVSGTALILAWAQGGTLAARILSFRPFVGLGLISYSVYLWHQPLFAFARHASIDEPPLSLRLLLAVASVVCGIFSWRFVEQPFRTQALGLGGTRLGLAATVTLLFAGFSLAAITSSGFSNRPQFSRPVVPGYTFDNKSLADSARDLLRAVSEDQDYAVFNNAGDRKLWFSANPATRKVLIIGNSHSMDLYNVFAITKELFPQLEFARYGIQISSFGYPDGEPMFSAPNYLAADVIMISTRWSGFRFEARSRGRSDFKGLEVLVDRTENDGKLLVITSETPQFPQFGNLTLADHLVLKLGADGGNRRTPNEVATFVNRRYFESVVADARGRKTKELLRDVAARFRLIFLDKEDFLCDEPACTCFGIVPGGGKTYRDYGHFTLDGARAFGQRAAEIGWLDPVTVALGGE